VRVILMHNPTAGSEDHSARDLVRQLRRAGHQVVDDVSRRKHLTAALKRACDLVVVAGGDGTVGNATQCLARTGVPFAIIPLGTANNIARAFGLEGTHEALIDAWRRGVVHGFDQALARRGERTRPFIESLGFGVFPEVMRRSERLPPPESTEDALARDHGVFEAVLARAAPRSYTVFADGEDLSGDYLLVEVMNTPMLGPNLPLAPGAGVGDGRLDLVLVGVDERRALSAHLARLRAGKPSALRLAARQVRQVVVSSADRRRHHDGKVVTNPPARRRDHVEVTVEPHALQVLVPRPG
jgi:diacylglycerol kinase family enzyme